MLITFEGADGAGKSTQIKLLAEHLTAKGHDILVTREPGGNPNAEAIRTLLISEHHPKLLTTTELLLVYAARNEHWHQTIKPALDQNIIVLCDRFIDSTIAYQGLAIPDGEQLIQQLHQHCCNGYLPDLTFIFDVDITTAEHRRQNRTAQANHFEDRTRQQAIIDNFRQLATSRANIHLINGRLTPKEQHELVLAVTNQYL